MALLDFLKKKEGIEKAKKTEKSDKSKRSLHFDGPAIIPPKADLGGKAKKERGETASVQTRVFSYEILKNPHISEKASNLSANQNQYIFKVYNHSHKTEIKKAVEGIYKVNVVSVNIIKIPKKKRRLGRIEGFKKGYKKAIVKIKAGQKIEII